MSIVLFQNTHLIYNPAAGQIRRHPEWLHNSIRILEQAGCRITAHPTRGPHDATRLAREAARAKASLIVVAGGDGTINETLNGMADSAAALAALPAGTANVLCRELGLGTRMERAAQRLRACEPVAVRVGVLETEAGVRRLFLCMAGVGLDAMVVRRVDDGLKQRTGKMAYWVASAGLLSARLPEFDARWSQDGGRFSFLLASRVRNYGGDLSIATRASLRRDDLEVVAFEGSNPVRYLSYFAGVLFGKLDRMRGVRQTAATQLELSPAVGSPSPVQVDGEFAGLLPARISIAPQPVTLLMPRDYR